MPDNLKDFTIQGPDGHSYTVTAAADATDDELIGFVQQNLPKDSPQETPKATPEVMVGQGQSSVPAEIDKNQNSQIEYAQGLHPDKPFSFSKEVQDEIDKAAANPAVPYEDYKNLVNKHLQEAGQLSRDIGSPEDLQKYRNAVSKGATPSSVPVVPAKWEDTISAPGSSLIPKLPSEFAKVIPAAEGLDEIFRGIQQGSQYMGAGHIGRKLSDWADVGGETVDAMYPNASPEQREAIKKSYIAWLQKGVRSSDAEATSNDNPILNFVGQAAVPDPVDILMAAAPVVKGATAIERGLKKVGQGAALNSAMDAGYQNLDVNAGVQDEYNPLQSFEQAAFGGALHGAIHSVHEIASSRRPTVNVNTGEPAVPQRISVPTSRKNSKAYKTQLAETAQHVADHINRTVEKWTNAPEFEVHENFKGLDGVESEAIGAASPDGKVILNTEAIIKAAKKDKVNPEDVVNAAVYHEALGHHGLAQTFGKRLDSVLTDFYTNGTKEFYTEVNNWMEKNPKAYAGRSDRLQLATEEVLAEWSENGRLPVTVRDRLSNLVKSMGRKMGLNLKYSTREVKTILGMAHDAVLNGKGRDVSGNGFKFMNIGERANGVENMSGRIRAQVKESHGVDPETIYRETGWWKDQDGEWRSRISDYDEAGLLYEHPSSPEDVNLQHLPEKEDGHFILDQVLHHPKLYDAYPWLKDMPIAKDSSLRVGAMYDSEVKGILMHPDSMDYTTLLHEVQHAIQHHEGWGYGGNTESALHQVPLKDHEIVPAAKSLLREAESDYDRYHKHWQLLLSTPDNGPHIRESLHNVEEKLTTIEGVISDLTNHLHHPTIKDEKVLRQVVENSNYVKYEAYHMLMGEIEARETEKLSKHTKEELKNVPKGVGAVEGWHPDYIRIKKAEKDARTSSKEGETTVQDERRKRQEQEFQGSRGAKTPAEQIVRRAEGIVKSDSEEIIDRGIAQLHDALDNHPMSGMVRARAIEALHNLNELRIKKFNEGGNAKYMREYKPSDEAAIESAKDIISGALDNYHPRYRSWAEGKRAARERGLTARQIRSAKSIGELDKKLFQYDEALFKTNNKLAALLEKRDRGEWTPADKATFLEHTYIFNEAAARTMGDQAEVARALNALKTIYFTKNKLSRLKELLSEAHDGGLSAFADEDTFDRFADQMKYLLESNNPAGTGVAMRAITKPYWWEYALSFRHSMMLSGLGTHAKNAKDNALMIARELEESVMATPGFFVRKGLQGLGADVADGVSPQEIAGRLYGILRATLDADTWKNSWDAFHRGHPNRAINPKIELADARIPIASKVGDALYAADTLFRAIHMNANLYSLGVRRAREEGFKGLAAFEEGSNYAVTPSEKMLKEAHNLTDLALLLDTPSGLSAKLESVKSIRPNMHGGEQLTAFVANLLFPFFRVTDRLLFQKLRRSPLAFIDKDTRADLMAGGARMDIAISRIIFGTALIYYYWNKAGEGKITGDAPTDYKKLQALQAGGYQKNSTLEDGKYTDATALNLSLLPGDTNNSMAANIASIREAWDKANKEGADEPTKEKIADALGMSVLSLGSVLSSSSFANNVQTYTEPFTENDDARAKTAGANLAGSLLAQWLPAAMRQYNTTYGDKVRRDTTGDKSFVDRVQGRLMADIPGQSEKLPVKHDVYGDEMQQGRSLSGMSNSQTVKTDAVSQELQRLEKTTDKPVVTGVTGSFDLTGVKEGVFNHKYVASTDDDRVKLTAAGKQEWQRIQGHYIRLGMSKVIRMDGWKQASDKQRIAIVKQLKTEASQAAKEHMVPLLGLQARDGYEEDTNGD